MRSTSKNFGEWSEIYALAYLLASGGGYGADDSQERIPTLYYKVLKALVQGGKYDDDLIYVIESHGIAIYSGKEKTASVSRNALMNLAEALLADLSIPQAGSAFPLASGDDLLRVLKKTSVAAPSSQRNDIQLVLEDLHTKIPTPWMGFSIKSQLNAKATLLNASNATNFIYEIVPIVESPSGPIPEFGKSLKADMQLLLSRGYTLRFLRLASDIHQENMDLIDSRLAEYIAQCLFETTQHRNNDFSSIVEYVFPAADKSNGARILKIKQYLGYVMLGMTPSKPWSGQPADFGGMIIVKASGDVLFYYLYNMYSLQEFLFKNLKFEYGKRSRHKFGQPYQLDGKILINLNLQLRFK
jgi:hypothetical protein